MQLYKLLSDTEKKAVKALDIRNVHLNDPTIEEVSLMADIIELPENEHELGAIRVIREIYKRHTAYADNQKETILP